MTTIIGGGARQAGGAIGERYTATVSRAQADLTPVIVAIIGRRHALTRQNDERDMGDNDWTRPHDT